MIRNQITKKLRDFRGGRIANENPATMPENHLWVAQNVFFLGDGMVRRRNGYTQVKAGAGALGGKVLAGFDFQRQSDQKQFVMLTGNGKLAYMNADGTGYTELSAAGEDAAAIFNFIAGYHSCYAGNGKNMYTLLDTGAGALVKKPWGVPSPAAAPTITTGAGSLTLKYGRQYVRCAVRRWTDAQGTQRYHIGAPSPISAHTGPQNSKVINLAWSALDPNDAQITHWWIFATRDTPFNTASVFGFAAEVTVATAAWGDTLTDDQIDLTRLAPWDNLQPPKADVILQYQNRIVWLVGNLVYVSGFEEIALGVPEETSPAALIFPVPAGTKKLIGGAVLGDNLNSTLLISTSDYWFQVTGYNAATLVKRDKVIQPGACGKKAIAVMPGWVTWIGSDKKLWAWDGQSGEPINLDLKIAQSITAAQLTLDSMDATQLSNIEVRYFGWGKFFWILVLCSTPGHAGYFDWIQVWDGSQLVRGSLATLMQSATANLLSEADMFPFHQITACWTQVVGGTQFLFLGASDGTIYRFPDGNTDAGNVIANAKILTIQTDLDEPDITKALLFVDLFTNRADAQDGSFQISASVSDGVMPAAAQTALAVGVRPAAYGTDPTVARAKMNVKGCSVGKSVQVQVQFPADAQDAIVAAIDIIARPLHQVNP